MRDGWYLFWTEDRTLTRTTSPWTNWEIYRPLIWILIIFLSIVVLGIFSTPIVPKIYLIILLTAFTSPFWTAELIVFYLRKKNLIRKGIDGWG